jgi:hypothetical protein
VYLFLYVTFSGDRNGVLVDSESGVCDFYYSLNQGHFVLYLRDVLPISAKFLRAPTASIRRARVTVQRMSEETVSYPHRYNPSTGYTIVQNAKRLGECLVTIVFEDIFEPDSAFGRQKSLVLKQLRMQLSLEHSLAHIMLLTGPRKHVDYPAPSDSGCIIW